MIAGIEITQLIWYPESTRELEETHNPLPIQIKMPPGACIEAARAWPLGKMQRISLRYTLPLHSWDRTQQALQLSCQHSWCADTYNFALNYENNFTNKSKYNSQLMPSFSFFFFEFSKTKSHSDDTINFYTKCRGKENIFKYNLISVVILRLSHETNCPHSLIGMPITNSNNFEKWLKG